MAKTPSRRGPAGGRPSLRPEGEEPPSSGGRAPDELAREALDKLLDGEGKTGFLERAISRVLEDKNPEEMVAKQVNELFEKFTRR